MRRLRGAPANVAPCDRASAEAAANTTQVQRRWPCIDRLSKTATRAQLWQSSYVRRSLQLACLTLLWVATSCGAAQHKPLAATQGAILGIARDSDSGDPVALATILARREGEITNQARKSSDRGLYQFLQLAPGRYTVMGTFAGQTITANDVIVVAGEAVAIDLSFAFGHPDTTMLSYGDGQDGAIMRFRPKKMAAQTARIEGTLTDNSTRGRVVGAAISLIPEGSQSGLQQDVTDDYGQFRFDNVPPGTYSLSSYYALESRGQVELRRSGITVGDGDGVRVPLWVEVSK